MKCIVRVLVLVIFGILLLPVVPAIGENAAAWTGKRIDGTKITNNDLNKALEEHKTWTAKAWVESEQKEGNRLQLQGADLIGVKLNEPDLRAADLHKADLTKAKLIGADLRRADLQEVKLISADLSKAKLHEANLRGANLYRANLKGAEIQGIKLEKANLLGTKIDASFAKNPKWQRVWKLINEKSLPQDLSGVDLREAYLRGAKLSGKDLSQADLHAADLNSAKLRGAILSEADLSEADLIGADLSEANLNEADLKEADLSGANLDGVVFELKAGSLPNITAISSAENISKMRYLESPQALVELREAFKKAGLLAQERRITYAIKRSHRQALWGKGVWETLESLFNLIFFELTCRYGMKPGRPLIVMVMLVCFLAIPYTIVLIWPPKKDGIWQIWFPDRVHQYRGSDDPVRLRLGFLRALKSGFFFTATAILALFLWSGFIDS